MTFLTFSLTTIGGVLLTHAIYSSYEHSLLPTIPSTPLPPTPRALPLSLLTYITLHTTLPTDIILETLLATFLLILSIVLSAPDLRPIRWNEWAGKIEREGWDPAAEERRDQGFRGKGGAGNVYRSVEERKGFWDVRRSRREFAGFVKGE